MTEGTPPGRAWTVAAISLAVSQVIVSAVATRGIETIPPDALSYLIVARSLLEGAGYTVNFVDLHVAVFDPLRHAPEMHGLIQPFPFAALLAVLGDHVSLIRIPGFLYVAGAGLAAFFLARRAFGPGPGLVACLLVLTQLRLLSAATMGADDVGFAFLFTCMLGALYRALLSRRERDFVLVGLLGGLASAMKPLGLFQPLVFAVIVILWKPVGLSGLVRRAVAIGLPFAALSSLYLIRNLAAHGGLSGRVSPLNIVQKTLGVEAVYRLYDEAPTLVDVVREVGLEPLLASAVRQIGAFLEADVVAAFTVAPTSAVAFTLWYPAALFVGSVVAFALLARRHRELAALYGFTLVGAVGFVCVLWHYEPRYLTLLIPLQAVLVSGLVAPGERSNGLRGRLGAALAAALLGLGVAGFAVFTWQTPALTRLLNERNREAGCADAYRWIRAESGKDARILTFNPWDVSWFTKRDAVVLPSGGPEAIATVARRYDAGWLVLQHRPGRSTTRRHTRQFLAGATAFRSDLALAGSHCRVFRIEEPAG